MFAILISAGLFAAGYYIVRRYGLVSGDFERVR